MAGYIGSKSSVTLVDGYSEAEADAEFVNDPNDVITVSGSNVGIGTSSPTTSSPVGTLDAAGVLVSRGVLTANQTSAGVLQHNSANHETTLRSYGATSGTGSLVFNTGGGGGSADTERMRIDASGRVTMPYQPSFLAHTMTGFNSSSNIMKNFVTMQHNTGGHFNNSTGYFTAPVAGKYLVNSGVLVATGTGRLEFNVQINSSSPYLAGNGTGTTYDGPTLSGVFNLSANDTIRVILVSGSPHSNGNHPNTYFGVTLLG